jgi:hypothetical protein
MMVNEELRCEKVTPPHEIESLEMLPKVFHVLEFAS